MVSKQTARISDEFKTWIENNLMIPHDLTMRASTGVLAMKLKGQSVIEVKDKKGRPKRLQIKKRMGDMNASEFFNEINL